MKKIFSVAILVAMILAAALAGNAVAQDGIFAGDIQLQRKEFNRNWMYCPEGFTVVRNAKFVWNFSNLPPLPYADIFPLGYNIEGNFYYFPDLSNHEPVRVPCEKGCYTPKTPLSPGHYLLIFGEGSKVIAVYGFQII